MNEGRMRKMRKNRNFIKEKEEKPIELLTSWNNYRRTPTGRVLTLDCS